MAPLPLAVIRPEPSHSSEILIFVITFFAPRVSRVIFLLVVTPAMPFLHVAVVIDCISAQLCCTGVGLAIVVVTILGRVAIRLGKESVCVDVITSGRRGTSLGVLAVG